MTGINQIESVYRDLMRQGREILPLFSGNPVEQGFVFPGEILRKGYEKYFATMEYRPTPKGDRTAREAICDYYREGQFAQGQFAQGKVSLETENILVTSGTSESYLHILSTLCRAGDNILVPHPGYPLFDSIAETVGVTLHSYRLLEGFQWAVDMDSVAEGIDDRTRAIIVISPHNPTGSVMSESEVKELVALANERRLAVISDEVFSEFVFGGVEFPRVACVAKPDLLFTLNGISKMFALPSMKLSWIALSGDKKKVIPVVDSLETKIDTYLSCHTAIQKSLPLIFDEGRNFVQGYRREVERRRDLAIRILQKSPKIHFHPPHGGFYLTAKVDVEGMSEEEWVIALMKKERLFVHPGYFYDCEEGVHFVLSFLSPPPLLERSLERIVSFAG